jgi:hypothetical protein
MSLYHCQALWEALSPSLKDGAHHWPDATICLLGGAPAQTFVRWSALAPLSLRSAFCLRLYDSPGLRPGHCRLSLLRSLRVSARRCCTMYYYIRSLRQSASSPN